MKIKKIKLKNFRCYKDEISIEFNDLTTFVGKNDVGKSTILEILDVFFNENKGVIKLDKSDINIDAVAENDNEILISIVFDELPPTLVIDSSNSTNLKDEYLLTSNNNLEIVKRISGSLKEKVFIRAYHPSNPICAELHLKKQNELKNILDSNDITCDDRTKNAEIRKSIWKHYSEDLQLQEKEIDVTKEDAKNIWEQLKNYMPLYSLFQSDRKNSDGDSEIQDPMQLAVKEILEDEKLKDDLNNIASEVEKKLKDVANRTLEKITEMNPEVASSLNPVIPPSSTLKWAAVFKNVTISGDENIPINKRGSGIKRLVLLNFFRAEAEKKQKEKNVPNIIYAIEEPETSQHPKHQRILIKAFIELSKAPHTQIILTTHSPAIVKMLDFKHLMLIKDEPKKDVINIEKKDLPYPSLNEVNYTAFEESNEEYHNELYGFIESENLLDDYKIGKDTKNYIRIFQNGGQREEQKILSEYIRHQIHHPENNLNKKFTFEELQDSIAQMRSFIKEQF